MFDYTSLKGNKLTCLVNNVQERYKGTGYGTRFLKKVLQNKRFLVVHTCTKSLNKAHEKQRTKISYSFSPASQKFKMELFEKIINGLNPLTIFAKSFILDVWIDFESASLNLYVCLLQITRETKVQSVMQTLMKLTVFVSKIWKH